jgi:uncharacterized CHY-type Zn-finger protein
MSPSAKIRVYSAGWSAKQWLCGIEYRRLRVTFAHTPMMMNAAQHHSVCGVDMDSQTRCSHYRTPRDIIAIKMKCCERYYACKDCHEAPAGHTIEVWPRNQWDRTVVLCGACGTEMSIREYLACENACPACQASFNPACRDHYRFYFGKGPQRE